MLRFIIFSIFSFRALFISFYKFLGDYLPPLLYFIVSFNLVATYFLLFISIWTTDLIFNNQFYKTKLNQGLLLSH